MTGDEINGIEKFDGDLHVFTMSKNGCGGWCGGYRNMLTFELVCWFVEDSIEEVIERVHGWTLAAQLKEMVT